MAFLSWRRDYEVGVAQIDAEHHGLFDLINEFHDTHARGDARKETAQVLNRLVAYAEEHFQHEEKLMSDSGYPQLDKQRAQHSALVASIFEINERLAADTAKGSTQILPLLKDWLVVHIVKSDMDLGDFLRRRDNQAAAGSEDQEEFKKAAAAQFATEPEQPAAS